MKKKKRADGRYQKSFRVNGKKYFVYATSPAELEEKVFNKRKEIESGIEKHNNPTVNEFFSSWIDASRLTLKECTIYNKVGAFNKFKDIKIPPLNICFGEFKINEVKPEDIRALQRLLINKNEHTQTINYKIGLVSSMFNAAIREQIISFNPCTPVLSLKRDEERARDTFHRALTKEETRAFIEEAEKRNSYYLNVFKLALLTGMRMGEIGALLPGDIQNGVIRIEKTITRTEGGGYMIGNSAKTEKGRRSIPINEEIAAVLKDQKRINKILDGDITNINAPLFRSPRRGLQNTSNIDAEITRICEAIGIKRFTAHAFRATFATRMIEQGVNPRTVQELLGHADFGMTMDLYTHVMDETKKEAMQALDLGIKVG